MNLSGNRSLSDIFPENESASNPYLNTSLATILNGRAFLDAKMAMVTRSKLGRDGNFKLEALDTKQSEISAILELLENSPAIIKMFNIFVENNILKQPKLNFSTSGLSGSV